MLVDLVASTERIKVKDLLISSNYKVISLCIMKTLNEDSNEMGQDPLGQYPLLDTIMSSVRLPQCSSKHLAALGTLHHKKDGIKNPKWYVSVALSDLLDDPSVLIEGVLFRARYLGSTQLVCEGQPTKSTRMCQAEEAVSRIKVHIWQRTFLFSSQN